MVSLSPFFMFCFKAPFCFFCYSAILFLLYAVEGFI